MSHGNRASVLVEMGKSGASVYAERPRTNLKCDLGHAPDADFSRLQVTLCGSFWRIDLEAGSHGSDRRAKAILLVRPGPSMRVMASIGGKTAEPT